MLLAPRPPPPLSAQARYESYQRKAMPDSPARPPPAPGDNTPGPAAAGPAEGPASGRAGGGGPAAGTARDETERALDRLWSWDGPDYQ